MVDADHGIDELTTATINRVRGFGRLSSEDGRWMGREFGFPLAPFSDLRGGDVQTSLGIVDVILRGRGPKGLVDTIIFNAAVALWIVAATRGSRKGWNRQDICCWEAQ